MIKYLSIFFFMLSVASCVPLLQWQTEYPDNIAEEYVEGLIQDKTGYDVDFTPITGEEKQTLNPAGGL